MALSICILYAYNAHPKLRALRDIPHIKIYLIAFCWTFSVIIWPYIRVNVGNAFPLFLSGSIFLFILAATIPFDIRDLVYDAKSKHTIPQLFGIEKAKALAILILLISAFALYIYNRLIWQNPFFYIAYGGLALLIVFSSTQRNEKYFSGLIDGWIIFLAVLIYLI